MVGIGMPDVDSDDIVAFKYEGRPIKSFRNGQAVRDQSRETAAPVLNQTCPVEAPPACIHYLGRGDQREPRENDHARVFRPKK